MATARPAPVPRPVSAKPPSPPSSAPSAKASKLGGIQRQRLATPLRYCFYGPEGVGKSSLAADAPSVLFLDIEGGSDYLSVARYPFRDGVGGHVPRDYADVTAAIDDLIDHPGHGYEHVAIDTIDALEALVHAHVCKQHGQKSIEGFGYGKGYNVALDEMRALFARFDRLRDQGVSVILIGHSIVKTFKNPEGEDYDRFQPHLHEKIAALVKRQCEIVGFVGFESGSAKLAEDAAQTPRARGWSSGKRLVRFAHEAPRDAKTRVAMPGEIDLNVDHPWAPIAAAVAAALVDAPTLRAQIGAEPRSDRRRRVRDSRRNANLSRFDSRDDR